MSLSSISIRRPVLAIVMSLLIILFGIIGYTFLGVREYPSVDLPVITVTTNYTGANAGIIESQITEPLEESINGIAGIRSLTSISRDGRSTIRVEFELSINLEDAANDVRDRVSRSISNLSPDADPPVVAKSDADANPILFINLKSDKRNLIDLTETAENVFKERLQTISGVSQVVIWGPKRYSVRLWMIPEKLAGFNLTPLDVRNALLKENIELPSGKIEGQNTELTVRTLGKFTTLKDFENMTVKEENGHFILFSDIGYAEVYPENDITLLKRDGIPMVGLVIIPQPGANHIEIADEVYRRIKQIKVDLPADIEMGIGFDNTRFIRESITEVEQTIFIAFGLVILIIFLFLRDWRTTIIPIIAIPISLIGAFFIMYLANFSINVLTLLGIVLAIGIVVDDAIVVLENIYRKIEEGTQPMEAATKGASEIFFAIISTTAALASVFLPIIFLQGITGRLFREFGIVLAGSVLISAFVALTITPMLSSRMIKRTRHSRFYNLTEPFFVWLNSAYQNSLESFMKRRWLAFVIIIVAASAIYFIGRNLQDELAPVEDRSSIRLSSTAPEGSTFNFMEDYVNSLASAISDSVPEKDALITVTSPSFGAASSTNSSFIRLILKPPDERKRSQQEISDVVNRIVLKFNDARTFVIQEQSISSGGAGLPVQFVIQAPNIDKLKKILPVFLEKTRQDPTFLMSDVNLKFSKPELTVEIDRLKARELGVTTSDIAQTLQLAFSGQRFDYFIRNGKQYQVIGQVPKEDRNKPADLKSLYVRNTRGELIQLDNLVNVKEQSSPPALYRYNRYASATVSASLAQGKTIGDGINAMRKIASEVLDDSFSTALDGPSKDFAESSSTLIYIFILAIILIYLVLAAQFESFRDPFIIMFTVPLAIAGAVLSLWYFNQTLNIFSQIGQIMLIGLVTKNGILIVEFANQQREAGLGVLEAVKKAAALRFRPILMTSLSTILGTLPIALALGAGSESRVSMGISVIGGLILSTILTLYVIPAIYSYFTKKAA